jgi:hypothetical protein
MEIYNMKRLFLPAGNRHNLKPESAIEAHPSEYTFTPNQVPKQYVDIWIYFIYLS